MTFLVRQACAFVLLVSFASAPAIAEKFGSVAAGSYGPVTYEEIQEVELITSASFMKHPYEVVVSGTTPGRMIACQLYDNQDQVLIALMSQSTIGETRIHFTENTKNASVRCFYANVERKIRPSTALSKQQKRPQIQP